MDEYWSNVARTAVRESLGRVRLDTPASAALVIGPAVILGAIAWMGSGNAGAGVLTAVVAFIVVNILVFGLKFAAIPPRLAKEAADKVSAIQRVLDEISVDRPIAYEDLTLQAQRHDGNILLRGVTLLFRNSSDRTMFYTFKDVALHIDDRQVALEDQEEGSGLIGHREEMEYTLAPLEPVEIPRLTEVIVDFTLDYDNQPPLRVRTTGRRVSCTLESLDPLQATYVMLEEREL